ncbi:MAG: hypothetical protein VB086_11605 [Clostridiaceae bacterium]|nr:hypothetical protein [Clostridiaceae bacterium]
MDRYQVYYFSRTGNSERIAKKLAGGLSCPLFRINDDADWRGIRAYIRLASYAKGKRPLKVICDGDPGMAQEIIAVSPIWGSRLTPSVQKFLSAISKERVHIVTSSMMDHLRGGEGFQSVTEVIGIKKNEAAVIGDLLGRLRSRNQQQFQNR